MIQIQRLFKLSPAPLASLVVVLASPASAVDFRFGNLDGSFSSNVSVGTSWRVEDIDPSLVFSGNLEGGRASTSVTDDGNLNFRKGDMTSFIVKGVHEL
jgi:hypothetical protein